MSAAYDLGSSCPAQGSTNTNLKDGRMEASRHDSKQRMIARAIDILHGGLEEDA